MSEAVILDANGRPVVSPPALSSSCPQCRAPKSERGPSGGFGVVRPCCQRCGHVFEGEVWRG